MKLATLLALGMCLAPALTRASEPARSRLSPQRALEVRWPLSPAISPDGSKVAVAVKTQALEDDGTSTDLFLLSVGGAAPRLLTRAGSDSSDPAWSPDGKKIAFVSRRDGSVAQLYVIDLDDEGGEAVRLTSVSGGAGAPLWSPDGARIAFTSLVFPDCPDDACNRRRLDESDRRAIQARAYDDLLFRHWDSWSDGRRTHVFVVEAEGSAPPRDVTPGPDDAPPRFLDAGRGFSFAGPHALVVVINKEAKSARSTNHDLFLAQIPRGAGAPATRTPKRLTTNAAWDAGPMVSPDGRRVAYLAMERAGFEADRVRLRILELGSVGSVGSVGPVGSIASPEPIDRTAGFDRSIEEHVWLPDGSALAGAAYDRGFRRLVSIGASAGDVTPLLDRRSVRSISAGPRGELVFVSSSLTEPPEVHLYDPRTRAVRPISRFNEELRRTLELGAVEELSVESGGATIHGFLVLPPKSAPAAPKAARKKAALVVLIHGGPQASWTSEWGSRWNAQLFAAHGYAVAMPNFRGSIGYGQAFTDAVTRNWGGAPYEDVLAFTDAAGRRPDVDGARAAAAGASYGGYLVNWIAGHSDRYRALISHAGLFNLESFWGHTEELWFPEWELGGPPWQSVETYRRWSPHLAIDRAKTPTLIVHGAKDFRVPISEGIAMFTSLRRRDVPARLVHFPDEGHWIVRPKNFVYWCDEMFAWLDRWL